MTKEQFIQMMEAWYDKGDGRISITRDGDYWFIHSGTDYKFNFPVDFIMCGDKVEIAPENEADGPVIGTVRAMKITPEGKFCSVHDKQWVPYGWFSEKDLDKL